MSHQIGSCGRATDDLLLGSFHVHFAAGLEPRLREYRLRYEAFVEEHHWESADACHDRLECDDLDRFSCSALLIDAATGEAAACQRLILPERLPANRRTNAEREYRPLPSAPVVDFTSMPRDTWAEASRLTIAPAYRWGSQRASTPAMAAISYASLALAIALGRTVLFTISDPRTARLTRRMSISMQQISQFINFHGTRAVFRIELPEAWAGVPTQWQPLVTQLIEDARRVTSVGAIDEQIPVHAA